MRALIAAFASAALAFAPLAAAQAQAPDAPAPEILATTPEQDLDCVVWALFVLGSLGEEGDPQSIASLSVAAAYFTGLYEGKTGRAVTGPLKARSDALDPAEVPPFGSACVERLGQFSERLQSYNAQS